MNSQNFQNEDLDFGNLRKINSRRINALSSDVLTASVSVSHLFCFVFPSKSVSLSNGGFPRENLIASYRVHSILYIFFVIGEFRKECMWKWEAVPLRDFIMCHFPPKNKCLSRQGIFVITVLKIVLSRNWGIPLNYFCVSRNFLS